MYLHYTDEESVEPTQMTAQGDSVSCARHNLSQPAPG